MVEALRARVSVVYHPLQQIDAHDQPVGKRVPRTVLEGDVRVQAEQAGGYWPRPLASGLSFPRWYLERVLPIPVTPERVFADTYLALPAPFHGSVVGIPQTLALNRVHGANTWTHSGLRSTEARAVLRKRGERVCARARDAGGDARTHGDLR